MSNVHDLVSKLSPREQFKFAFLEKCAEQGLSADEMLDKAAAILEQTKKSEDSWSDYLTNALKGLGVGYGGYLASQNPWIPAAALGVPLVGGALAGRTLAKMQEPAEYDIDEIKRQETLDEYRKQTERLQREKRIRDYRAQDTGRGGRPML